MHAGHTSPSSMAEVPSLYQDVTAWIPPQDLIYEFTMNAPTDLIIFDKLISNDLINVPRGATRMAKVLLSRGETWRGCIGLGICSECEIRVTV